MNSNQLDKHFRLWIRAQPFAIIGTILIGGSLSGGGAVATDLLPTRSFVMDRVAGNSVFSADMKWLATGQQDGTVAVWNVADGELAGNWNGSGHLAFLPGSAEVLLASGTNITVRELLTGRMVRRLESPTNTIISLTVPPAGNVAAATIISPTATTIGTVDIKELLFWNLGDGQIIRQMPTTRYPWEFSPRTARTPRVLPISITAGFCRAFSHDGGRLAVGLESAQVDLWSMAGTRCDHYLDTLPGPGRYGLSTTGRAEAIEFLDNQRLAVVYNHEQLSLLTLNTNDVEILQALPRMLFTAKNAAGELVTGEVVADAGYKALVQVRQLGLVPIAVEIRCGSQRTFAYSTNAEGQPVCGTLQATNSAAAIAQIQKLGLTPTLVIDLSPQMTGQQPEDLDHKGRVSSLRKQQTLIGGPGLEIRSLATSGDGRRLAVAGMRMNKRPGALLGAGGPGSFVYDAPRYGEVQVWDAVAMNLLATMKGKPDEKFSLVALDKNGGRVAAVTDGVHYNPGMIGAMQQSAEMRPVPARRVYVWELQVEKPVTMQKNDH